MGEAGGGERNPARLARTVMGTAHRLVACPRCFQSGTLLRAKPSKGGDAELRGYGETNSPCPPGRQRIDLGQSWRPLLCALPKLSWSGSQTQKLHADDLWSRGARLEP